MKSPSKNKIVTILVIIATIILAGVAVFTAIRLYQLRKEAVAPTAPESKPEAANVPSSCTALNFTIVKRPDICDSSTISSKTLKLGGSVDVTIKSKEPVKEFQLAFYNLDNLYGPDNPKAIMFDDGTGKGVHYLKSEKVDTATTSHTFTVTQEELNHKDLHPDWTGKIPTNIQINGYFIDDLGRTSAANGQCVQSLTVKAAAATPTPTATPTTKATPTPTSAPGATATPTPTSAPGATATPTQAPLAGSTPTPPSLPNSGTSWPTVLSVGAATLIIIGSLLLAL